MTPLKLIYNREQPLAVMEPPLKYVQKLPNAGQPGYDPFPVFYDHVVHGAASSATAPTAAASCTAKRVTAAICRGAA